MQVTIEQIESDTELSHLVQGIEYRGRCAVIPQDTTEDSIDEQISRLDDVEQVLPFALGDLFLAKQAMFGRTPDDIAKRHGYSSSQTVKDRMVVSRRIPHENRVYSLSYSIYRSVTKFEPEEQRYWLEKAQREGLRTWELRSDIKSITGKVDNKPLQFDRPNKLDTQPLTALGSADGGNDYLVDRQDEAKSSHGNYSQNGHVPFDYGESDLSYAIGHKADELGRDSDLEDDIEVLRQERDRAVMEWRDMRHTIASLQEAMADLQENHRKAVLRLGSEKEQLQANLEAIGGNLYQVLESNHLAYDLYLLDAFKRDGLIDNSQYDNLKALRNDVSFDEDVKETVYIDEEF